MAESSIIKEFLVALGYKVDESSAKKFVGGVTTATKAVERLGVRVEATALAVAYGVARWASNLEQLYFATQRVGSSGGSLKAYELAAQNFGASADEAMSSVENLAAFLRNNPGGSNVVAGWLGAVGLSARGTNGELLQGTALMAQLGKMFAIQRSQGHTFLANQMAGMLGISERTMLAMSSPGFEEEFARDEKQRARWDAVIKRAHEFESQLRGLKLQFMELMLGFEGPALAAMEGAMRKLAKLMHDHGKQIVDDLASAFTFVIEGLGRLIDWLDRNGKEVLVRLEALFLDFNFNFTIYIEPALSWLHKKFLQLDEVTGGWSTKVLALTAALKVLGATGLVTGVLNLGAGLAKAAGGALGLGVGGAAGAGAWGVAGTAFGLAAWGALGLGLGLLLDHFFPETTGKAGEWAADKVEEAQGFWQQQLAKMHVFQMEARYGSRANHAALDAQYSPHFEISVNNIIHHAQGGDPAKTAGYVASATELSIRRSAADLTREFLATVR